MTKKAKISNGEWIFSSISGVWKARGPMQKKKKTTKALCHIISKITKWIKDFEI